MEKQTKQTLKVLSTLALASGVVLGNGGTADAKSYKPEVRYDNGDYFVKTSDPSAKGKTIVFSTDGSDSSRAETQVSIIYDYANYNGEELNISKYYKMGELGKPFTSDTPFSIVDDELPEFFGAQDPESVEKTNKFIASAKSGFTTVNKLNKVEKTTESTQPAGAEQPAQPTGPKEPGQPTGPTQPAQPAGPEQPVQPAGPKEPAQPAEPKLPAQPTGPEQPVEPTGPKEPAQPKKSALSEIVESGKAQNNSKNDSKELFGQLATSNKDDKKVESTIKSEGKVNAKKALPNTGLQTSSYALLGSIIGLVGIMALRRKKSN